MQIVLPIEDLRPGMFVDNVHKHKSDAGIKIKSRGMVRDEAIIQKLIDSGIKVDAIITDLPYGTTNCKWDIIIPFDKLWQGIKQLRKERTPIVLFGQEPFSSHLRLSNIKEYKYDW